MVEYIGYDFNVQRIQLMKKVNHYFYYFTIQCGPVPSLGEERENWLCNLRICLPLLVVTFTVYGVATVAVHQAFVK